MYRQLASWPRACGSLHEAVMGKGETRGQCLELTGMLQALLVACTCPHTVQVVCYQTANTLTYAV